MEGHNYTSENKVILEAKELKKRFGGRKLVVVFKEVDVYAHELYPIW